MKNRDKCPSQLTDSGSQGRTFFAVMPPVLHKGMTCLRLTIVFDLLSNNCQEFGPMRCLIQSHVEEVDNEPLGGMLRTFVHFVTADVWEYSIGVFVVLSNQTIHFRNW